MGERRNRVEPIRDPDTREILGWLAICRLCAGHLVADERVAAFDAAHRHDCPPPAAVTRLDDQARLPSPVTMGTGSREANTMWITSGTFWAQAAERAAKTAAQAVLTTWGVGDVVLNAFVVDWPLAGGVALGGAAVSLLTSIVSVGVGPVESPSLVATRPRA